MGACQPSQVKLPPTISTRFQDPNLNTKAPEQAVALDPVDPKLKAIWLRILRRSFDATNTYPLARFARTHCNPDGTPFSPDQLRMLLLELKRFFFLAAITSSQEEQQSLKLVREELTPPPLLDQLWASLAAHTRLYKRLCLDLIGKFLPRDGRHSSLNISHYLATRQLYSTFFSTQDSTLWLPLKTNHQLTTHTTSFKSLPLKIITPFRDWASGCSPESISAQNFESLFNEGCDQLKAQTKLNSIKNIANLVSQLTFKPLTQTRSTTPLSHRSTRQNSTLFGPYVQPFNKNQRSGTTLTSASTGILLSQASTLPSDIIISLCETKLQGVNPSSALGSLSRIAPKCLDQDNSDCEDKQATPRVNPSLFMSMKLGGGVLGSERAPNPICETLLENNWESALPRYMSAVSKFQIPEFITKAFRLKFNLDRVFLAKIVEQYKKYLCILALKKSRSKLQAPCLIQKLQEIHVQEAKFYELYCQRAFRTKILHCEPKIFSGTESKAVFNQTNTLYEELFGSEPNEDVWGSWEENKQYEAETRVFSIRECIREIALPTTSSTSRANAWKTTTSYQEECRQASQGTRLSFD